MTNGQHIPGGYVLLARGTLGSKLWALGADACRLAEWLLLSVRYQEEPKQYPEFTVRRGEIVTSLAAMAEGCEWWENRATRRWSRQKVMRLRDKLVSIGFCKIIADTYGTHLRVCNYDHYQNPEKYNADNHGTTMEQPWNNHGTTAYILKEGKEGKEENTTGAGARESLATDWQTPNAQTGVDESAPVTLTAEARRLGAMFSAAHEGIRGRPLPAIVAPYAALLCQRALSIGIDAERIEEALTWLPEAHGRQGVPRIRDPRQLQPEWFESVCDAKARAKTQDQRRGNDFQPATNAKDYRIL